MPGDSFCFSSTSPPSSFKANWIFSRSHLHRQRKVTAKTIRIDSGIGCRCTVAVYESDMLKTVNDRFEKQSNILVQQ